MSEKLTSRGLVLLIAYTAVSGGLRASSKTFWCDEVITVALARLPTLGTIRDALAHAADSHPPPFYVVERIAARLPINELIAFRIPSILAYCCMVLCIFLFVKKRRGGACGLVCAAIPMTSVLFTSYAVEARGYSLMAGFVALAMVCYQRADKAAWWVAMGLSLAAAQSSHYYAIFAIFVFGLAELAFFAKTRRLRFGVWLALVLGALPLALFWPLLRAFKTNYGAHITGRLSLDEAARAYGWLFDLPPSHGVGIAFAALAAVLLYGFITRPTSPTNDPEILIHEHVLALAFLILPLVMYGALRLAHGGFSPRYLLLTVLGFALASIYIFPALNGRLTCLFLVLLIASVAAQEAVSWRFQLYLLRNHHSPTEGVERLLPVAGHYDLPLVDSDPLDYLPLAYYASPELNRRTVFLADAPAALTYAGSDTADKCILALRPYLKMEVYEFKDFATTHSEFLLYSDGRPVWDWWPTRLLREGYALELLAMNQGNRIYLVRQKR